MQRYWTNFARSGSPSAPGAPPWPQFSSGGQRMISLVPPAPQVETEFAAEHQCAFWAAARGLG
jgi:carboxylesterase type B